MMGIGLPIGSLKKDEIYTFMGGAYIAISWLLYFLPNSINVATAGAVFTLTALLLLAWLSATIILYVFLALSFLLLDVVGECITNKYSVEKHKIILNVNQPVISYIEPETIENYNSEIILSKIIIISTSISLYPVLFIMSRYVVINSFIIIGGYLLMVGILAYRIYKFGRMKYSAAALVSIGYLDYIDIKKYSEENSLNISRNRNEIINENLTSYMELQNKKKNSSDTE